MENETTTETDFSFAKELAKTLAISATTTTGIWLGMAAAGLVVLKVQDRRKARSAKNTPTEN